MNLSESDKTLRLAGLLAGLALLGGGLAWMLAGDPSPGGSSADPNRDAAATEPTKPPQVTVMETPKAPRRTPREGVRGPSGALAAGRPTGALTTGTLSPADETTETDRQRWDRLGLQIVPVRIIEDGTSRPLQGVTVTVDGLHIGQSPEQTFAHGTWRKKLHGKAPSGVTDTDGRAWLASPVILDELTIATGLSFSATKAGYAKRRIFEYPVDGTERDEALKQANTLTVRVVRKDTGSPVSAFFPVMSLTARVQPADWTTLTDGAKRLDMLPDGQHLLIVSADEADGVKLVSKAETVDLSGGESRELVMEVYPALTLRGRVGDNVPRPVTNGRVVVAAQDPPPGTADLSGTSAANLGGWAKGTINPDGTFEVVGLPEGQGEIIAVCDGFVADYISADATPAKRPMNQVYSLGPDSEPMELRMVPTGTLRVTVQDDRGAPLAGVNLFTWPNVFWADGASQMYVDREIWNATTGPDGTAEIRNLRPGSVDFALDSKEWSSPVTVDGGGRVVRDLRAEIRAKDTTTTTVRMVRTTAGQ